MGMTRSIRSIVAALACVSLSLCSGAAGRSSGDNDWVSRYDHVASDPTWTGLKKVMLASTRIGRVASIRIQSRGEDVGGAGDQDAVGVLDLLGRNGHRRIQVDVWRY